LSSGAFQHIFAPLFSAFLLSPFMLELHYQNIFLPLFYIILFLSLIVDPLPPNVLLEVSCPGTLSHAFVLALTATFLLRFPALIKLAKKV
jgi:hypothetical protein